MSSKRMNVLVYSGTGSTVESVRHCLYTLRRLLAPNYAVIPVTGDMILKEPWTIGCSALVFPGGADQGYCRTLNGEGNRKIRQFVEGGGTYIGFCAGGYYGSKRCEFEVGHKYLEVIGERELAFFPGIARGCAFAGFVYNSERGTRAAELQVNKAALSSGSAPNVFKMYYNGGSVFVDASKFRDQGVEVLANYTEHLDVDPGEGQAAVVYCKVGDGAALLTGPHPEFVLLGKPADNWSLTKPRFAAVNLEPKPDIPGYSDVIKELMGDEDHRIDFMKACLMKLGMVVNHELNVPSLSRLYVSSTTPSNTGRFLSGLSGLITKDHNGEELLKDDNDTFHIVKPSMWNMADLTRALPTEGLTEDGRLAIAEMPDATGDRIIDYSAIIKQVLFHDVDYPEPKTTPYFNHLAFYANLKHYQERLGLPSPQFGAHLLYGEVVTSTNTMLEKNTRLLRNIPHGFTATATVQVAGRGRGSNVWISPPGTLLFSTVVYHPMSMLTTAPVVFIQYLAAMAVVDGIKHYDGSLYEKMPIKLKWPNDIFALDPDRYRTNGGDRFENYTKIGGILVNSHYDSNNFIAVCGIGLNVSNAAPTTSLNQLVSLIPELTSQHTGDFFAASSSPKKQQKQQQQQQQQRRLNPPSPFTLEKLLASILTSFESLYTRFLSTGFDPQLENMYYRHWLHMDQTVTVETVETKTGIENETETEGSSSGGGARARIKGITNDYGLLVAEELDRQDRPTGKRWELMTDSNSFDFFRGLLKRKEK